MQLTKETLYRLIKEVYEDDPNPNYAKLYDPTKPMALYHDDLNDEHVFYLYHLTGNRQNPVFVISYLSMGMISTKEKKCIPNTFHVQGTYTEVDAQQRGFSKTLYNIAFYMASKFKNEQGDPYGLTSDQYAGTTDVADTAAWAKYEKSDDYYKRETALGNNVFDYTGKLTPDDKDDDCEAYTDKVATSHSFQKNSHGDIPQLYINLSAAHERFSKLHITREHTLESLISKLGSDRFFYYYGREISP